MKKARATVVMAIAGVTLAAGTGVAAATPGPDKTQRQIAAFLAAHPGTTQTGKYTIAWKDGVTLKLKTEGRGDCPGDSLCLWEHAWFTGQLLTYPASLCGRGFVFNLTERGFNDVASSWANTSGTRVGDVWEHINAGGYRLWQMFPTLDGANVDKDLNDKASSVTCS